MAATVETVKEERPAIDLSCKRKVVQAVLKTTGLAIYLHSMEDIKTMTQIYLYFLQRIGSCRSSHLVSW